MEGIGGGLHPAVDGQSLGEVSIKYLKTDRQMDRQQTDRQMEQSKRVNTEGEVVQKDCAVRQTVM